ncbi:MAG TPA: hypothetical protein VHM90_20130, partial [Phycisphaerae bacterium]|nr:hypothetical protein [Phycisphaerae bacterium]
MMTQTMAIFLDAYRELNARKMFWTVLGLNVLAVLAFAILGSNGHSMTVLWYEPFGDVLTTLTYKKIYSNFVVGFWFTWVASVLALISTAGIFPDLMSSGSIDLYVAKPIGRLRLFLTKYAAGLLFVTLQVTIFTFLSFLVLGIRAGIWEPGLFFAIPLVVLFFSYLSGICTLLGVWTRSTIAALLLTILVWGVIFGVDFGDKTMGRLGFFFNLEKSATSAQIDSVNAQLTRADAGEIPLSAEDRKRVVEWR